MKEKANQKIKLLTTDGGLIYLASNIQIELKVKNNILYFTQLPHRGKILNFSCSKIKEIYITEKKEEEYDINLNQKQQKKILLYGLIPLLGCAILMKSIIFLIVSVTSDLLVTLFLNKEMKYTRTTNNKSEHLTILYDSPYDEIAKIELKTYQYTGNLHGFIDKLCKENKHIKLIN